MDLKVINKHPIVEINGKNVFVDTGAPISFHNDGEITIGDKRHKCPSSIPFTDTDFMSENIGTPLSGLLGMDIMMEYDNVLFDYAGGSLLFNTLLEGTEYKSISNIHCGIELIVNGRKLPMAVDTGAPISYLPKSFTQSIEPVGEAEDFYPGIGTFTTKTFVLPVQAGGKEIEATFGNLPDALAMAMQMVGAQCVIGYDLFANFKVSISKTGVIIK